MQNNYEYLELLQRRRLLLLALLYVYRKRRRRNRRYWVRPIIRERINQGDGYNLVNEMRLGDQDAHFQYCRKSVEKFNALLQRVQPLIEKQVTNYREPISAKDRLYLTLRFLSSGDLMSSMAYAYRVGRSTVSMIVQETCEALWNVLQDKLFQSSSANWTKIAAEFEEQWNFPYCIGAIDGKHVAIKCPDHAGSTYYNYKGFHSIVLMAIVSASYRFMLVDIGAQGRHSDGGVFLNSVMGQMFHRDELNMPMTSVYSVDRPPLPYMLVADEAFQLNKFTLRPYPGRNITKEQKIFNYRLSRARRVVENAFGIMAARFRICQKPIITSVETAEKIIKAIVVLHNFLLTEPGYCSPQFSDSISENGNIIEGQWRQMETSSTFLRIGRAGGQAHSRYAANIREEFKNYFLHEGAVPWQWNL